MGYYLSNKNKVLAQPYLKLLEKKKSIRFEPKNITALKLIYILRQAVNTTHHHLKPFYKFRYLKKLKQVDCEYSFVGFDDIPEDNLEQDISQEIVTEFNDITIEDATKVNVFTIVNILTESPEPVRISNVELEEKELIRLKAYCDSNNRILTVKPFTLEII